MCPTFYENEVKMKSFLCVVLLYGAVVIFTKTNGGCPIDGASENNTMKRCDGSYKSGRNVHVDFYQIKQPCICTLKAFFNGDILMLAKTNGYYECKNKVTVSLDTTSSVFNCKSTYPSSKTFTVVNNETIVNMKAEYIQSYTSGDFPVCFVINENGGRGGIVHVQCGNPTSSSTATTATTTTTFSSKKPSSEIINSEHPNTVSITDRNSTTNTHSSPENLMEDPNNPIYTIAGAAAGSIVVLVLVVLIVIIVIQNRKKEKHKAAKETGEVSERTNRAFDENEGLPDNPLYHSNVAEPVDEVGYSTIQKEQLGLPPTDEANKRKRDPDYDVPPNNKPITDPDTSSIPIYAVPNKSAASSPEDNQVHGMYAQVSKPRKGSPQVPVQAANQDGLMYLEVVNNSAIVNQNNPYTKNENKDGVTYAEIKRN
uniref:Uncharacterized protein LOC111103071 isoform X2 n=1 Tax=Crassostrea virginica TaxID=6565 RepID=A0A8B8AJR5_CRAVI|nr:uncharacterized protein LOC111103071 isoform X2 [Crassostrea virginica]